MVTCSIKWEMGAISGRLPDNPGEMAPGGGTAIYGLYRYVPL